MLLPPSPPPPLLPTAAGVVIMELDHLTHSSLTYLVLLHIICVLNPVDLMSLMWILLFISFVFIVVMVHPRMFCPASCKFYFARCNSVFSSAFIFQQSSLKNESLKLTIIKFCCCVFSGILAV
jgi:hypothetical protein